MIKTLGLISLILCEVTVAFAQEPRPRLRPDVPVILASAAVPVDLIIAPRPRLRSPEAVEQVLFGRAKKRRAQRKGAVCGDRDIQGSEVGYVPGRIAGCGITDAVKITSVAGVSLSQPATLSCETAQSLRKWVEDDVQTAFGRNKKVTQLRVAAHYACRTRNNRSGAKLSEHGKGRAIDISGFVLENGQTVTVLNGWRDRKSKKALQSMWKGACGPFGTVLGPNSDRYHQDHFHLDTAKHRGGSYCR